MTQLDFKNFLINHKLIFFLLKIFLHIPICNLHVLQKILKRKNAHTVLKMK